MVRRASSLEAGPMGMGSLTASSARSTLHPVNACTSSANRWPVGGSELEVRSMMRSRGGSVGEGVAICLIQSPPGLVG